MTVPQSILPHSMLTYRINPIGTILDISGPWDGWLEHDGRVPEDCRAGRLLGNNLLSYIENEGVRFVYRAMHAHVLNTGRALVFPYRCDSARFRREMKMRISLEGDDLRYDSIVVGETLRPKPLPESTPGTGTLIAVCSFCNAYRFPAESDWWKDLEELFAEPELPSAFSTTHGICDPCATLWLRQL
jgi:hypothetical protein